MATTSRTLAYLQLLRLPNVFTAFADVVMGYLFVRQSLSPPLPFVCLLIASGCLYSAGMVLNDVFDLEVDREERPFRPLPSGRIDVDWAKRLGYGLLAAGIVAAISAGFAPGFEQIVGGNRWRGGAIAIAIAVFVLLYDGLFKPTLLGPLFMAGCRFGNVLLGMSVGGSFGHSWHGFAAGQWIAAGGVAVYILGVTVFAKKEAEESNRLQLARGWLVMLGGFGLLSLLYQQLPVPIAPQLRSESAWYLLLGIVGILISRACLTAIFFPSPARVQYAVKNCLLSLIIVDGAIASLVAGASWGTIVVALILPTIVLGKWVYST